ncbi:hypothetical protein PR048_013344 [Dryococelus australis]|uniref:DUF4371 domain-containing protein n=1 Tax=Dryococelus australis TaxID=614101 RepID=A0ABQ9HRX0_9NEOP|nr:hypothetical protein PR048_013344 [Dryococelus australis]
MSLGKIKFARTILQELDKLNLDISYCRGQAYDGNSNMSGKFTGVQVRITKVQPLAIYNYCANHRLNLAISKACSVTSIRNYIRAISSVSNFFRESEWQIHKLETEVQEKLPHHKKRKTCPLGDAEYMDIIDPMKLVKATLASLRKLLYKITDTFKKIFKDSEKLAMEMGTQINKPRTTKLQKTDQISIRTHMKNTIALQFLKSELQRVRQIQKLLSPEFSGWFEDEVLRGAETYKDDLPSFLFDIMSPENLSTEHNDRRSAKWTDFAAPSPHRIRNEA